MVHISTYGYLPNICTDIILCFRGSRYLIHRFDVLTYVQGIGTYVKYYALMTIKRISGRAAVLKYN